MLIGPLLGGKRELFDESLGWCVQRLDHVRMQELAREVAKGVLSKTPTKASLKHGLGEEGAAGSGGTLEDRPQVLAQWVTAKAQQSQGSARCASIKLFGQGSKKRMGEFIHGCVPSAAAGR